MSNVTTLLNRNLRFAEQFDAGDLGIPPRLWMVIVSCLDARVDPAHYAGLELGDAFVITNAGGRITPAVLQDLAILGVFAATAPGPSKGPLEVVVVQHTDCGMARLAEPTVQERAAERLGISADEVAGMAIIDPTEGVRNEIERLRSGAGVPDETVVSGYVYDVTDGTLSEVVPPGPLRSNA